MAKKTDKRFNSTGSVEDILNRRGVDAYDMVNSSDVNQDSFAPFDASFVDYKPSSYDPGQVFQEDLPNLGAIRAENQGFLPTLGNAIGRVLVNTIPTVIGNTAAIFDIEDYANQDNEVGNAVTRAMEEFKASVNQDYLPIYRRDPNASFDIGDSAWWLENGSALAESIGAFAITGAGLGAGFSALGKGLGMIRGLSQLGEAGKAAATVLSSVGLNQAESITTAMQVYDGVYNDSRAQGKDDASARQDAADAASYSINMNRVNVALNLTSAGAFIRSPKLTRQVREAFGTNSTREMFKEGSQEYLEETINYISQREGERYGKALSEGKQYSADFNNMISDALSAEGIESGVLGFIGGAGQTAATRLVNRYNGNAKRQDEAFLRQQESLGRINSLAEAAIVPEVSSVFKKVKENTKLQKDIDEAVSSGDEAKVTNLQYQLFNNQLFDALENGTVQQLEDVYTSILNLSPEEARARGLDSAPKSKYNYKNKAQEAINIINDVEESYLDLANSNLINKDQIFPLIVETKTIARLNRNLTESINQIKTNLYQEAVDTGKVDYYDLSNPSDDIKSLPSYPEYEVHKFLLDTKQKQLDTLFKEINRLKSSEVQSEERTKIEEAIAKQQEKERIRREEEEKKEVNKRKKESKKKVQESKKPDTNIVEEEDDDFPEMPVATYEPIDDTDTPTQDVTEEIPEEILETSDAINIEDRIRTLEDNWQLELDNLRNSYNENFLNDPSTPEPTEEIEEIRRRYESQIADLRSQLPNTNIVTVEDKVTSWLLDQEEMNEANKALRNDGIILPPSNNDLEATRETLSITDTSIKRTVANTIISLNIDYTETILGNVSSQENEYLILDNFDEDGNILINENFDSRLQDPKQFKTGDVVKIIVPTYEQMRSNTYSESDYNRDIQDPYMTPIAFVDNNNKIIGFLPTTDNVNRRVNEEHRQYAIISNKNFRDKVLANRDKDISVVIKDKSVGSLILNARNNKKSIYNALGDGTKLSDNIKLSVFKNNNLKSSIRSNITESLINKSDLKEGHAYAVLPTASENNYIAVPLDINTIGNNNAKTALKLIQLFKASDKFENEVSLVKERDRISQEYDLSNYVQFKEALDSILYSTDQITDGNDSFLIKFTPKNLILGLSKDLYFNWADVMNDKSTQNKIVDILSNRYHSVQLSRFTESFNLPVLDKGKISLKTYNNYLDYLNEYNVLTTNVQGVKIDGTSNSYYFTAQSVIEVSDPQISDRVIEEKSTVQVTDSNNDTIEVQPEQIITYNSEVGDINYITNSEGNLEMVRTPPEENTEAVARPAKPKNKMGIKLPKKDKSNNTTRLDEDLAEITYINSFNSIDEQANELMNKCSK